MALTKLIGSVILSIMEVSPKMLLSVQQSCRCLLRLLLTTPTASTEFFEPDVFRRVKAPVSGS